MLSAAGKTFANAPRTPASFRALASAEPQTAASWLLRFADTAGVVGGSIQELRDLEAKTFDSETSRKAAFASFFSKNSNVADLVDVANLQAARASTLGFTVIETTNTVKYPAYLTGVVKMTGGMVQLETGGRTFKVDSPNWENRLQLNYLEANALGTFDGMTVTVKAYPTGADTLAIEEFSPGLGTSFLSGRLQIQGGKIGVRVRPDKWVAIRDPELERRLHELSQLGVILPGKVTQEGSQFVFEGAPRDFWMLAANSQWQNRPTTNTIALAHGKSRPVEGDISTTKPTRRVLIYGHVSDDAKKVVARKALATPEVKNENGVAFSNDAKALAALTPVELPDATPVGFEAQ